MKIVFYSQRVENIEKFNEKRDCIDRRVPEFIKACGYLPVAVPNNLEIAKQLFEELKPVGIFLTGGNSLVKYGGDSPERDLIDHFLLEKSVQNKIPLYGFCRGMQSILDYFGNELVNVSNHVSINHYVFGENKKCMVNSYHNQGCINLKCNELISVMKSEDGVIEMIKHVYLPIVGTMWHPEREKVFKKDDIKIIKELIDGR